VRTGAAPPWASTRGPADFHLAMHFADQPVKPTLLLRDNDTKYTKEFDALLEAEGGGGEEGGRPGPEW
jgi:hypothetical protein